MKVSNVTTLIQTMQMNNKSDVMFIMIGIFLVAGLIVSLIYLFRYASRFKRLNKDNQKLQERFKETESEHALISQEYREQQSKLEEYKQLSERNYKLAYFDQLTGLPNRYAFRQELEGIIGKLLSDSKLALLYMDIDGYSELSEALGQAQSEELLLDISHRIKQALAKNDILARDYGVKFLVLIKKVSDTNDLEESLKKLYHVFEYPFLLGKQEISISVSTGVTLIPRDGKNLQTLLKNAETALSYTKQGGGGSYYYYSEEMHEKRMRQIQLHAGLKKGLMENRFQIMYQMLTEQGGKAPVAIEANLYYSDPDQGLKLADQFLDQVTDRSLLVSIGCFMMRGLIKTAGFLANSKGTLPFIVPIRQLSFFEEKFIDELILQLQSEPVPPDDIWLQLEEGMISADITKALRMITRLKSMGFRILLPPYEMEQIRRELLSHEIHLLEFDTMLSPMNEMELLSSINDKKEEPLSIINDTKEEPLYTIIDAKEEESGE